MTAVELLRIALKQGAELTLALVNDMRGASLTFPTPNGGNHPLWVMGHLAYAEGHLVQEWMLGKENPVAHWQDLFGMGSQPSADAAKYSSMDELLAKFQQVRGQTLSLLDEMTDKDLDQPAKASPPELKDFFGTYGLCLLQAAQHTMHHRGQVADARRAAERKPMMA